MPAADIVIRPCLPGEAQRLPDFWKESIAEPTATDDLAGLGVLFAERDDAGLCLKTSAPLL